MVLLGQIKQADPNLKRCSLESICKQLMGSAQSIGLQVRPNGNDRRSWEGELDLTGWVAVVWAQVVWDEGRKTPDSPAP